MNTWLDRLRRWVRMAGVPHHCLHCGLPMSAAQNGAGLWVVCCPRMWVSFSDTYLQHSCPGHTVERLAGPPLWGGCGHEHRTRHPLEGYPV